MSATPDATARNPVKEVRQALGLSLVVMAQKLGTSPGTVWQWEQDSALPRRNLTALARLREMAKQAGIEIEL